VTKSVPRVGFDRFRIGFDVEFVLVDGLVVSD